MSVCERYLVIFSCVVSSSLLGVVSPGGGASAQTAGPSGNTDVRDISQASSDDLHDGCVWGGGTLPPPSSFLFCVFLLFCGNGLKAIIRVARPTLILLLL